MELNQGECADRQQSGIKSNPDSEIFGAVKPDAPERAKESPKIPKHR